MLAVIILGSHINEAIAKIYWRKKLVNKSCYEQASFLYKLIRFYRMFPAKYTNVRSDRVKTYLCLYVNSAYPCNMQENSSRSLSYKNNHRSNNGKRQPRIKCPSAECFCYYKLPSDAGNKR